MAHDPRDEGTRAKAQMDAYREAHQDALGGGPREEEARREALNDEGRDEDARKDTRTRLVDAARELFWRKGYHVASVAEILEWAGANSGSLYHFFPTKQHLLLAVLEWYVENLGPEIVEPARARTDDPLERVFAILDGYRQALLATDFHFGCPIGNLALEFKEPDPPVRELLARNFDGWCEAVAASLEEAFERELEGRGAEDGRPGDVDPEGLSRFVLTTMEGGVMQARTHRSIEPYDASVRHLRRYLEGLVTGAGGRETGSPPEA